MVEPGIAAAAGFPLAHPAASAERPCPPRAGVRGDVAQRFRPELLRTDDPEYVAATAASFGQLTSRVGRNEESPRRRGSGSDAAYGAWALVHGMATLWTTGNLPVTTADEAVALFHRAAKAFARPTQR